MSTRDWSSDVCSSDLAGRCPIIGANGVETDARQHWEGAARNEEQTAVIIPVIETVPRAPLTAKTVPHVNNRSKRNDFRPLIHTEIGRASCRERVKITV